MVQFARKLRRSFRKEMNRAIRKTRGTPNPPACLSAHSAFRGSSVAYVSAPFLHCFRLTFWPALFTTHSASTTSEYAHRRMAQFCVASLLSFILSRSSPHRAIPRRLPSHPSVVPFSNSHFGLPSLSKPHTRPKPSRYIIGTHSKGFASFGRGVEVAKRLECGGKQSATPLWLGRPPALSNVPGGRKRRRRLHLPRIVLVYETMA